MSKELNGTYTIQSVKYGKNIGAHPDGGGTIGRPIPVVSVPESLIPPKWYIQKNGDNIYSLTVENGTAIPIDRLVATLPQPGIGEWRITHSPLAGDDIYTIATVNDEELGGWVLNKDEPFAQVGIAGLIVAAADPQNQLFSIRVYE
ncbi:hypothetical protein FRB94_013340 [Tulasnella sp. JGI-2019a]|nr:hypothetical protein FRB93_008004 [Tulasnella sp. JGI-2019a]KAG8990507.1 hypothetical protein FRB94_013340 [Tulasnella sp. JGI-2019a]KAG9027437.1 hypothetical protein FRB95_007772 [Tulasnella sp. JGI-2019a]